MVTLPKMCPKEMELNEKCCLLLYSFTVQMTPKHKNTLTKRSRIFFLANMKTHGSLWRGGE